MNSEKQTNSSQGILTRACKQCNNSFEIRQLRFGRGSSNVLRKVFCSNACKNLFGKTKSTGKKEAECQQCTKKFLRYPSQQGKFCSYECKNKCQRSLKSNICKHCKISFEQKPTKLNLFYCSRDCFHAAGRAERICVTCKKTFICKRTSPIIRCSRRCQFTDQSNGKIKLHLNGRTGYRLDLGSVDYFKSSLEADFARVMNYSAIKFKYEPKTFQTEYGAYTPDFFLPEFDLYVELKGVEISEEKYAKMMTKNLAAHPMLLKSYGVQIITITQREFITALKCINLWKTIPNLEQRNYKKTRNLVIKHEDKTTPANHSPAANPIN